MDMGMSLKFNWRYPRMEMCSVANNGIWCAESFHIFFLTAWAATRMNCQKYPPTTGKRSYAFREVLTLSINAWCIFKSVCGLIRAPWARDVQRSKWCELVSRKLWHVFRCIGSHEGVLSEIPANRCQAFLCMNRREYCCKKLGIIQIF